MVSHKEPAGLAEIDRIVMIQPRWMKWCLTRSQLIWWQGSSRCHLPSLPNRVKWCPTRSQLIWPRKRWDSDFCALPWVYAPLAPALADSSSNYGCPTAYLRLEFHAAVVLSLFFGIILLWSCSAIFRYSFVPAAINFFFLVSLFALFM